MENYFDYIFYLITVKLVREISVEMNCTYFINAISLHRIRRFCPSIDSFIYDLGIATPVGKFSWEICICILHGLVFWVCCFYSFMMNYVLEPKTSCHLIRILWITNTDAMNWYQCIKLLNKVLTFKKKFVRNKEKLPAVYICHIGPPIFFNRVQTLVILTTVTSLWWMKIIHIIDVIVA